MLGLLCFLLCLRESVLVVIIGTVHGGELGIFLGVAKITLVLGSCSYWEIPLEKGGADFFTECRVGIAFSQKVFMNTEF